MKYESTDEELTELKTDESSNRLRVTIVVNHRHVSYINKYLYQSIFIYTLVVRNDLKFAYHDLF